MTGLSNSTTGKTPESVTTLIPTPQELGYRLKDPQIAKAAEEARILSDTELLRGRVVQMLRENPSGVMVPLDSPRGWSYSLDRKAVLTIRKELEDRGWSAKDKFCPKYPCCFLQVEPVQEILQS